MYRNIIHRYTCLCEVQECMPKGMDQKLELWFYFFPTLFERRLFPFEKSPFLCLVLSADEETEEECFNESEA